MASSATKILLRPWVMFINRVSWGSHHSLFLCQLAIAASPSIVVLPILISNLTPRPSTSILPALLKACIPVCANDPVIQTGSVYVPHSVLSICSRVVFHKTEATGRFLHLIQTHDDLLYITTLAEELINLFFSCIKGKISNI